MRASSPRALTACLGSHYSASCLKCHTVGYDTNAASLADDGFYATATGRGLDIPDDLANSNGQ